MTADNAALPPDIPGRRPYDAAKRLMDFGLSAVGLVVLAPVLAAISALVAFGSPGSVWYRGVRVGRHGRPFRIWKFRTMRVDSDDGPTSTSEDDPRITSIGHVLRRYKLDELPQLWNVLVGDMSLVGPRPQVSWAVERYTEEEKVLLTIRPGITDPASLRFANEGEILRGHPDPDRAYLELIHPEKMRLSIAYVKHRSFFGDLKILLATVGAALRRPRGTSLQRRDISKT
jgi:lipopolysaccharide/colanic/teichoic acid biosynthesis glycosyltransferase